MARRNTKLEPASLFHTHIRNVHDFFHFFAGLYEMFFKALERKADKKNDQGQLPPTQPCAQHGKKFEIPMPHALLTREYFEKPVNGPK